MIKLLTLMFVLFFVSISYSIDTGYDTLRYYLSKSSLVVVGQLSSEAFCLTETGVLTCSFQFNVREIIVGKAPSSEIIYVHSIHFTDSPCLKPNTQCIAYLKPASSTNAAEFEITDVWFGLQPTFPILEDALKSITNTTAPNKSLQRTAPATLQAGRLQKVNLVSSKKKINPILLNRPEQSLQASRLQSPCGRCR